MSTGHYHNKNGTFVISIFLPYWKFNTIEENKTSILVHESKNMSKFIIAMRLHLLISRMLTNKPQYFLTFFVTIQSLIGSQTQAI